ncbi:hypothetical protein MHYP_G00297930 [Metynnis hypsauchen]
MTEAIIPNGCPSGEVAENGYFKKGCNPLAQTGRSKLQNQRASLNQQIIKQMRMRAGAENLLKATSNNKVRDMVLLELSYVNANLQRLMEQLEGLNSSVEVYQNVQGSVSIPLIPLGLKETKDVDFTGPFKDFILEHYSEDGASFQDEIDDLMDIRKACRTPSRNDAGVELLSSYFSQLSLLESRFFSPNRQMGIFFTWYDSFTGVPVCQQNMSLEKASVLFNIGALYTQIGTRSDRQTRAGLEEAITAFQRSSGVLHHLKETFTHTPSYDMSPAMLSMLIKMMLAQVQECLFEKLALPGIRNEFFNLIRMAQEAAKVGEVYDQVHQSMIQMPIKDNVPFFWSTMAQVKTQHYRSLAHYFISTALLDHQINPSDDEDKQEKALSQLYDAMPDGHSPLDILRQKEERRRIGKAHLKRAIIGQEEALRIQGLCRHLRKLDVLNDILQASHKRSLSKFEQYDKEDEFTDYMDAPDIISKTEQKAEMEVPASIKVKVKDIFHRLGPLSVFSAKQRWTAPRTVRLKVEDRDLGFTLKGDAPVQIQSLDPLCYASADGLKEGDYLVAVGDTDCKWMGVSDVMKLLKDVDEEGIDIKVVSVMDSSSQPMPAKSATYSGGLPKTYSMICLAFDDDDKNPKGRKVTKKTSFLSWGLKNKHKSASTLSLPTADYSGALPIHKPCPTFPSSYNDRVVQELGEISKHIAHGLIPAATIAPRPAVPRTPPPRSPNPSPERPRSALAAAILSSSLTGRTVAIPPPRHRSYSESDCSHTDSQTGFEPYASTALYTRDQWPDSMAGRPRLPSPQPDDDDEEEEIEDSIERDESHVYQSVERQSRDPDIDAAYATPLKKGFSYSEVDDDADNSAFDTISPLNTEEETEVEEGTAKKQPPSPLQARPPSCRSMASPDLNEDLSAQSPKSLTTSTPKRKTSMMKKSPSRGREQDSRTGESSELLSLRQQAQELVDENDGLKMTVHRLNVELSRYQARFRPLTKEECSQSGCLPVKGPSPPWLLDMKYLSPLLLAYEEQLMERDKLLKSCEEEVKRLRARSEEVIQENEKLHTELGKRSSVSNKEWRQLQDQARLVLEENQVLIEQLELQHAKAKETHNKHTQEVCKVSKQVMLLEAEKQALEAELETVHKELQILKVEFQKNCTTLQNSVSWGEHTSTTDKLKRQMEEEERMKSTEIEELQACVNALQAEKRTLLVEKTNLSTDVKHLENELQLARQANRKAQRRIDLLKQQVEDSLEKELVAHQYLTSVVTLAEKTTYERDQLMHMASCLEKDKQGVLTRIIEGTVHLGKLQEKVKCSVGHGIPQIHFLLGPPSQLPSSGHSYGTKIFLIGYNTL